MYHVRIAAVLALTVLLIVTSSAPLEAQPTDPAVVRVFLDDQEQLDAIAGELDIWEAQPGAGYIVAAVTPAQYQWLDGLEYRL